MKRAKQHFVLVDVSISFEYIKMYCVVIKKREEIRKRCDEKYEDQVMLWVISLSTLSKVNRSVVDIIYS